MFKKNSLQALLAVSALTLGLGACSTTLPSSSTSPSTSTSSTSTSVDDRLTVTFIDGDTVLKTEKVESGAVVSSYTPTKDGQVFVDWYLTPSFSRLYDFDTPVTANLTLYAAFSTYTEDDHDYYLAGSGTSPVLSKSNWGTYIDDFLQLVKQDSDTVNEYVIDVDLYQGDQFQVASFTEDETTGALAWDWQFGYGYIANYSDMGDYLESGGGLAASNRKSNINILVDGNYKIELFTYPDHDNDSTENAADKINNVDRLVITRNGDPLAPKATYTTSYYIKGSGVTNWANMYNSHTELVADSVTGTYGLEIPMKEGEEFLITSLLTNQDTGAVTTGTEYVKGENLATDETTSSILKANDSGNIVAQEKGLYTLTYDPATKLLSATVDPDSFIVPGVYYVNGNLIDHSSWNTVFAEGYELTETEAGSFVYEAADIAVTAGDQLVIAKFKAGSTDTGEGWSNAIGSFNYFNVGTSATTNANGDFEAAPDGYGNIVCDVTGTYDIAFDAYSATITFTAAD